MSNLATGQLSSSLEKRKQLIGNTQSYLSETERIFDLYGSDELKATLSSFAEMKKSLDSDQQVKLVVIGEFSRGKSSLVNALMGIELLRCAQEATTAINTFVRQIPAGSHDRFIRVHFQDSKPSQDVVWQDGDDAVLEKWSTELEKTNADIRKTIDHIEIFLDHPLLAQGLVIIDTPGLQSVVEHHEQVTRRAIAESHIALWVQSTQQLGGNATEWNFLANTIQKNFNKFLTVVNMWDNVLDPQDSADRKKPEDQRVSEKMSRVKENFIKHLSDLSQEQINQMTNQQHLIGVSAKWALSNNSDQKQRSNVPYLAQRIGEMLSSGEALEELYKKPLKMLVEVQGQLIESVKDELNELNSPKSIEQRRRESEQLDRDIKMLQAEVKNANLEADNEHQRVAKVLTDDIRLKLIQPLQGLKTEIELQLTEKYVEKQFDQARKSKTNGFQLGLPPQLHAEFERTMDEVRSAMEQQNKKVSDDLANLRADYNDSMAKHTGAIGAGLKGLNISLPPLDVSFELDFSEINDYDEMKARLQQQMDKQREALEQLEEELLKNQADPAKIQAAKEALQRAERQMQSLGSRPAPRERRKSVKQNRDYLGGGVIDFLFGKKKTTKVTIDDSEGESWDDQRAEYKRMMDNREAALEKIQKEEETKIGKRLSQERLMKKYEQQVRDINTALKKAEQQSQSNRQEQITQALSGLTKATVGEIDKRMQTLEGQVLPAIEQAFEGQLKLLKACVEEQFMQPLHAKSQQRQEIADLMAQEQSHIEQRKADLTDGLAQLQGLYALTNDALHAVH
jgi:GTPase SAR1 family protein